MSSMPIVHLRDFHQRKKIFAKWEKHRHSKEVHWAMECFAEMVGVFFYVYAGVGSQVNWVVGNIIRQPGLSSVLQVGFAYAFGILFALAVCSGTSGGHFNPAITICFVILKGFPKMKAVRYIIAQILGAFIACLLIYVQQKVLIDDCIAILTQAGTLEATQFTPSGPAGAFALYLLPGQTLGRAFLNEFVTDVFIALVIWATMDPTNVFVPPPFAPVIISLAYGTAVWGFSTGGLSANTARDLGARLMAMSIWGTRAAGGSYAAIAALTNIPATLVAACLYEFFLTDSDRVITSASLEHARIMFNHRREKKEKSDDVLDLEKQMDMPTPVVEEKSVVYTST
ncbi:aquaporin-like protein [Tricholoma matsutake]|nr:aquaporin-like protein [Tricholoma matsutake 945]